MTRLVANMVARNEAKHYLPQVLERLCQQVDMLVFTDDCSDDCTADMAESYGAKVMRMPEPTFYAHEGRLRQASWDHLENCLEGDTDVFVLAIDADEELYVTKYDLDDLVQQNQFDVLNVTFYHMWSPTHFRIDKAWKPHGSTRMFRYRPGGQFKQRQLACGSEPCYVAESVVTTPDRYFFDTGLLMKHLSYIKNEDKQAKYQRYATLDGGAFHANAHIESILDQSPVLVEWPFEDDE